MRVRGDEVSSWLACHTCLWWIRQLMDWKWFISAQEESENPQPSTFVQTPCEMAGASFGLSSYLRNKTWLVSAQCGRHAMRVSVLKQDKCSGNEFKHIFTMKADNFLSGLAGMVCVKPRGDLLLDGQWHLQQQCLVCRQPQRGEKWEMWARRGLLTQEHVVSWLFCEAWVCLGKLMDSWALRTCYWLLTRWKNRTGCLLPLQHWRVGLPKVCFMVNGDFSRFKVFLLAWIRNLISCEREFKEH